MHRVASSPEAARRLRALCELAVSLGVERVVFQSALGWPEVAPAEAAVRSSGADWTILRPAWFAQKFSEALLLHPLLAGEVRLPTGEGVEAFVDAQDVAEVAATVLTGSGHAGHLYEVTGPRLLSFGDAVAEVAEAAGRDFRFRIAPGRGVRRRTASGGSPGRIRVYEHRRVSAGVTIPQGDALIIGFGPAGRDPRVHGADADRFDVTRGTRKDHLAFGHGVHFCLGASLARLEAAVALPALFERFPDLALAVPPSEVRPLESFVVNGLQSLPVRLG